MTGHRTTGFYKDLAEERWLLAHGSEDLLIIGCLACGWHETTSFLLPKPERRHEAQLIAACRHWYECPNDPQVWSRWFDVSERSRRARWPQARREYMRTRTRKATS